MLKSKMHRATVTDSHPHYVGSITMEPDPLEDADRIVDVDANVERLVA